MLETPAAGVYTCHDLVSLFVRGLEPVDSGTDPAWRRAVQFYRELLPRAEEALLRERGINGSDVWSHDYALSWFGRESGNLLILAARSAAAGDEPMLRFCLDVGARLWKYLDLRSLWGPWENLAEDAIGAARRLGDVQAEALASSHLGTTMARRGRFESAKSRLTHAGDLLLKSGRLEDRATVLNNIGALNIMTGDLPAAALSLGAAIETMEAIDDSRICTVLMNLGEVQRQLGRLDDAYDNTTRALHLAFQVGDRMHEGKCRLNLGEIARDRGDGEQALDHYAACAALCDATGDRHTAALAEFGRATVKVLTDRSAALVHARSALATFEDLEAHERDEVSATIASWTTSVLRR